MTSSGSFASAASPRGGPPEARAGRSSSAVTSPAQPAGVLTIDVGAGTSDILLTRPGQPLENAVKLVVPSATQVVGARIAAATARGQTVVFRGPVMGGGAVTAAMKAHLAAGHAFVATETAAASFADDLDRVRALGARVVSDDIADEVLRRLQRPAPPWRSPPGDLDAAALTQALRLLGAEPAFAAVAVAVQDHGYAPGGSNRVLHGGFSRSFRRCKASGASLYRAGGCTAAAHPSARRRGRGHGPGRRRARARGRHRAGGALRRPAARGGGRRPRQHRQRPHGVPAGAGGPRGRRVRAPHLGDRRARPRAPPAPLAGRRPGGRRGARRPRSRRRARPGRRGRRPPPPAAHRHPAASRAVSPAAAARRVRGAARRHDAHRLLRPAARCASGRAGLREEPGA